MACALMLFDAVTNELRFIEGWPSGMVELPVVQKAMEKEILEMCRKPDWDQSRYVFSFMQTNDGATGILRNHFINILINEYQQPDKTLSVEQIMKRKMDVSSLMVIMMEDLAKTKKGRESLGIMTSTFPEIIPVVNAIVKEDKKIEFGSFSEKELDETLNMIERAVSNSKNKKLN